MKVIFHIEGGSPVQTEGNPGGNLLELARQSGIALDAPCSGSGTCGRRLEVCMRCNCNR